MCIVIKIIMNFEKESEKSDFQQEMISDVIY